MAITESDYGIRKAVTNNDTSANGGLMSEALVVTGAVDNLFPPFDSDDRLVGKADYRKAFLHLFDADDSTGSFVRLWVKSDTPGEDTPYLFPATETDTQADWVGTPPDLYGTGTLKTAVSAGATAVISIVSDGAVIVYRDGELVRIEEADGSLSEFATISGAPVVAGSEVTITLAAPLSNPYTVGALISSVVESADLRAAIGTPVVTSAAGTFAGASVTAHNKGARTGTVTITFATATTFTANSPQLGSLGSGNTSTAFAPINATTGTAYFTIATAAWGGTFAAGDTVVFSLSPAVAPVAIKRVLPSGAAAQPDNRFPLRAQFQV